MFSLLLSKIICPSILSLGCNLNKGLSKKREKWLISKVIMLLQNELLTYLWYLNFGWIFRGLEVIQKFNNNDGNV